MGKTCPTCGAFWNDSRGFTLPVGHPEKGKPHRCPVCEGSGLVAAGYYEQFAYTTTGNALCCRNVCRGCGGTGIVWG